MQLDTGATVSILPKTLYDQQFNQWPLRSTNVKLKAYNGVQIPVYGEVWLPVVYDQQKRVLPLIVVDGDGHPLLGRNWLKELRLNWHNIFLVSKTETLSDWVPSKASRRILNCKMVVSLYFAKPGQYPMPYDKKLKES